MKEIKMLYVEQGIKKYLSPFRSHFNLTADSMDDGTNRGFLKEDELVCREVSLEFWRTYRNLEVLNIVTVDSNEQILTGKIKHDPGSKTFILHRFNSNFQDVEFDLSNVKHIYAVEFASRECTLNYSHENN